MQIEVLQHNTEVAMETQGKCQIMVDSRFALSKQNIVPPFSSINVGRFSVSNKSAIILLVSILKRFGITRTCAAFKIYLDTPRVYFPYRVRFLPCFLQSGDFISKVKHVAFHAVRGKESIERTETKRVVVFQQPQSAD